MVSHKDDEIQQQTNSQSQAGAASQVVVNLFFYANDLEGSTPKWTVKPIVFVNDRQGGPPALSSLPAAGLPVCAAKHSSAEGETEAGIKVKVKGERDSNDQGQGLMVQNLINLQEILQNALDAGNESTDPDGSAGPPGNLR